MVDFNKAWNSAKMILVACLVFNLLMFGIEIMLRIMGYGAGAIGGAKVGLLAVVMNAVAGWGLLVVSLIVNFALIVYGGFKGAKNGNDLVGCGLTGVIIYGITDPIISILRIVAYVLLGFGVGAASGGAVAGALTGSFIAIYGLGILVCGICWYFAGLVLNFVIALVGGLIGGAK